MPSAEPQSPSALDIRPLAEADLPEAEQIVRRAFGTHLGAADPDIFMADRRYLASRWRAEPDGGVVATDEGVVIGSNIATRWGSVGFFGPLSVSPERWNQGVAAALLEPTMAIFDRWGVLDRGLFTFAESPKHLGLYQKFGFWPRALTAVMSCPVRKRNAAPELLSNAATGDRDPLLEECRRLTDEIHPGLDVTGEARVVESQHLGETVVLPGTSRLDGFAVCHCGQGTEAGAGAVYVKFGAARPGPGAARRFSRLLDACVGLAHARGLTRVDAGVSLARRGACSTMYDLGFRAKTQGIAMHRPDRAGYHRRGVYVADDWR